MIINKTVYQFFSLRQVNADFEWKIDNVTLYKSNSTTHVGVVLYNKLNFTNHVNTITEKVEKRISILKKLTSIKWESSQTALYETYSTYIKPIFKYESGVIAFST